MKRNVVTLEFIQNGIILLNKNKLTKHKINSVNNYKVINRNLFIEELTRLIYINKINNKILTDNINIIIDDTYEDQDKEILIGIFKNLSFNKIKFTNIVDILNIKDTEVLIDISTNSIKIHTKTNTLYTPVYYSKHKQILNMYLKNIIKNQYITSIKLYGNYPYTNKFIEDIERVCKIKTYIYSQPDLVPIKLLI